MLYMLELRLHPGKKEQAIDTFEQRGPNRTPGVKFRGAWIGSSSERVYALLESADEAPVHQACEFWRDFAEITFQPFISVEDY